MEDYLLNNLSEDACKNEGDTMSLEVRMSNHTAIRLYEKCGFISVGTRARYYADGEDALLMTRNFRVEVGDSHGKRYFSISG